MAQLVTPKTYLIGCTVIDIEGLRQYLVDTDQSAFIEEVLDHHNHAEALISFYSKMCYRSLVPGKNRNLKGVRGIAGNLKGTMGHGHTSVFEHVMINFMTSNCSRVFTHQLVRHRVGVAYSQESGHFVRGDLRFVWDPILNEAKKKIEGLLTVIDRAYTELEDRLFDDIKDMSTKKKLTSALRRILPNGMANEMGWSMNITALRHVIQMRTSRDNDWEIRLIFAQVFDLVYERWPLLFQDAEVEVIDGIKEVICMKTRSY